MPLTSFGPPGRRAFLPLLPPVAAGLLGVALVQWHAVRRRVRQAARPSAPAA